MAAQCGLAEPQLMREMKRPREAPVVRILAELMRGHAVPQAKRQESR
jgi:hypothetical protein